MPPQSLHLFLPLPWTQIEAPLQSLHILLCLPWRQTEAPPQSLHWDFWREWGQRFDPPQSLHILFLLPWGHLLFASLSLWGGSFPFLCLFRMEEEEEDSFSSSSAREDSLREGLGWLLGWEREVRLERITFVSAAAARRFTIAKWVSFVASASSIRINSY